jgi:CO/xanthine dehydrogenase Mo-binding subunit
LRYATIRRAAFCEVQVDAETGVYDLVDYHMVADVGTVIHPRALGGQILGRSILGIGHAIGHKWAKGIGEPPVAAGACAVLNAISDALGDEVFRRAPVNADTILVSLEAGRPMGYNLTANV